MRNCRIAKIPSIINKLLRFIDDVICCAHSTLESRRRGTRLWPLPLSGLTGTGTGTQLLTGLRTRQPIIATNEQCGLARATAVSLNSQSDSTRGHAHGTGLRVSQHTVAAKRARNGKRAGHDECTHTATPTARRAVYNPSVTPPHHLRHMKLNASRASCKPLDGCGPMFAGPSTSRT